MTQEEKQLLLKDLCARQFYGTKVLSPWEKDGPCELSAIDLTSSRQVRVFEDWFKVEEVKPYLRPMASMTEEEKKAFIKLKQMSVTVIIPNHATVFRPDYIVDLDDEGDGLNNLYDWLNAHHFDYRGLIEKGLALEAPEGMYKTE